MCDNKSLHNLLNVFSRMRSVRSLIAFLLDSLTIRGKFQRGKIQSNSQNFEGKIQFFAQSSQKINKSFKLQIDFAGYLQCSRNVRMASSNINNLQYFTNICQSYANLTLLLYFELFIRLKLGKAFIIYRLQFDERIFELVYWEMVKFHDHLC